MNESPSQTFAGLRGALGMVTAMLGTLLLVILVTYLCWLVPALERMTGSRIL